MPINPEILSKWESLEKICGVPDVLSDKTTVLFILESPHVEEVKRMIPAVGRSGKDMTKVLFDGNELRPMGEYLKEVGGHVGICNVSSIPLQAHAYSVDCRVPHKHLIDSIVDLRLYWNRPNYLSNLLIELNGIMFAKF